MKQDLQIIRFDLGNHFFNYFSRAVYGIRAATAPTSSDKSYQFIAEGALQVVTAITGLFRMECFDRTLLVTFQIGHIAFDINGDGIEPALSQQLSEDLGVDFSQYVGCSVTEDSRKF